MKEITLRPIKESTEDYEAIEKRIKDLLKREIYTPLIREFGSPHILKNSDDDDEALIDAIERNEIFFYRGAFRGRFNAGISRELRDLGATWDRKTASFKIGLGSLPVQVRQALSASEGKFKQKIDAIDEKLAQILPDEIADKIKLDDLFDRTLWKVEREFQASIKGIRVAPQLSPEQRKRIALEWQNNMKLDIKDWTEKEVKKLRTEMQKTVFAGNRRESAVKTIQKSYGVSEKKAEFLAQQETSLLMTKFKEVRYVDAGVNEYRWGCVSGSPLHPVRPQHKKLADASKAGKIYKWNDPPITSEPGQPERRNNPGQDYRCRCFARPVVRFK